MILPRVRSEETTGRGPAFGDSILDIENWHPTQASATIGALTLALRLGRLGRTFSTTDIFSAQASAIADALDPDHKSEVDRAISQIEEFRSRQDGWKGPNSFGPTKRTIDDAKTFAEVVLADGTIEPPHIGLAADGEITFFWQNPKITIDLTIGGDGTYAYFAKPVVGPPFFEDAAPVLKNFTEEIFRLMRRKA